MAKTTTKSPERGTAPAAKSAPRPSAELISGPTFTKRNVLLLAVALAVIAIGFVTLARGSITLAPILLVVGYLILVPLALLKR